MPETLRGFVLFRTFCSPCLTVSARISPGPITPHSLKIAEGHHRFCFSPCGGLNLWPQPPRLLARTSVDVSKPVPYLQTQLSGLQEWAYKSKQEWLRRLWSSVNGA